MRLREKYQLKNIELSQIIIEEAPIDEELVESVSETQQFEPIKVTQVGDMYKLIDGRRRVIAAEELSKSTIMAFVIQDINDEELLVRALVANAGKPNPMDEAHHIAALKELGWTQERIAKACRYDPTRVSYTVQLLRLIPEFQDLVKRGDKKRANYDKVGLPYTTGYQISQLPHKQQEILLKQWKEGQKLTHAYVLQFIRDYQASLVVDLEDGQNDSTPKAAPGLFISGEQLKTVLEGGSLDIPYQNIRLRIEISTAL